MTQSFTSSQVSERTGLTPRQLQWWDEQAIVVPARQGHRRLYSPEDLAELVILSGLRRRGFSLQRIRRMTALLRREFGRRLSDLLARGRELHLLTDGESVFLCDSERGVIDLLRNTQQPLLAICVAPMLEGVPVPHADLAEAQPVAKRAKSAMREGDTVQQPQQAKASKQPTRAPKKSAQSVLPRGAQAHGAGARRSAART